MAAINIHGIAKNYMNFVLIHPLNWRKVFFHVYIQRYSGPLILGYFRFLEW